MTYENVIVSDAQDLEIASPLIDLFEMTIGTTVDASDPENVLYFHAAKDLDAATANKDIIFDGNTYTTLPIELDDIEKKTGGAMNRPKLTIANVESILKTGSAFKTQMEDGSWDGTVDEELVTATGFTLDDLIGQRLTRRRTLEKYTGSGVAAVEFDTETFVIDRVASKNPIFVELELASPADIGGVRVPNRQVIGKYCPWVYQGAEGSVTQSACSWSKNNQFTKDGLSYSFYFTFDDEPLVLASYFPGSPTNAMWKAVYHGSVSYAAGEYVSSKTQYTADVNGAVVNSVNVILDPKDTNSNIELGFTAVWSGSPSNVTVVQTSGTYIKLSSAQSIPDGNTITFYSPNFIYRAETAVQGSTPSPQNPKWQLVRTYTEWSNSTAYTLHSIDPRQNPYVKHGNTIWRAIAPNTNIQPGNNSRVWVRGDACGKLLNSCKIRYQGLPKIEGAAYDVDGVPHLDTNSAIGLPFGGFPGSKKFR